MHLLPFTVACPLLFAAVLAALHSQLPRTVARVMALAVAVADAVTFWRLLHLAHHTRLVYWVGGWTPRHGVALGIALVADAVSAELGALVALIAAAALLFSWGTVDDPHSRYNPLMLLFLAGMSGLCVAGDLFTMFVFFELMGVAAYALTALHAEAPGLKGALLFAVTNSVGALFILLGIILLYARTGALNLAQIGRALAAQPGDGLVVAAFALLISGFLVKGAIVPFQFWLADTHAVAPPPVSALFSGVMVELGLYGAARIYWTVFAAPLAPHLGAVRAVLITLAVLTMLWGAIMAVGQRHLKRMLAFSTISHSGLAWAGFALFTIGAGAGSTVYMPGHGLIKAALFLVAGAMMIQCGSADELVLRGRGRGREHVVLGIVYVGAALMLAGIPPLGTYAGQSLIESSADRLGLGWLSWCFLAVAALTGGAALRAGGRIFVGWGAEPGWERGAPTELADSEPASPRRMPWTATAAPAILLIAAVVTSGAPGMRNAALIASAQFTDRPGYAAAVLDATTVPPTQYATIAVAAHPTPTEARHSFGFALAAVAIALVIAGISLRRRAPTGDTPILFRWGEALQNGATGDYVTWLLFGVTAVMAGMLVLR